MNDFSRVTTPTIYCCKGRLSVDDQVWVVLVSGRSGTPRILRISWDRLYEILSQTIDWDGDGYQWGWESSESGV